jgi:hypothetical protein
MLCRGIRDVVNKLAWKHNVTTEEVEEALTSARRFRFLEKKKSYAKK